MLTMTKENKSIFSFTLIFLTEKSPILPLIDLLFTYFNHLFILFDKLNIILSLNNLFF